MTGGTTAATRVAVGECFLELTQEIRMQQADPDAPFTGSLEAEEVAVVAASTPETTCTCEWTCDVYCSRSSAEPCLYTGLDSRPASRIATWTRSLESTAAFVLALPPFRRFPY